MSYANISGILVGERWYDTDAATINSDGSTINREYRVFSPSQTTEIDENAATVAVAAATPLLRGNLIRRQIDLKRYNKYGWFATISWESYKPKGGAEGYEETVRLSTAGNTAEVDYAINHVASYDQSGVITDENKQHGGLLNIKKEGGKIVSAKGVETVIRQLEITVERSFDPGTVDNNYIQTLYQLTGTVNDDNFRGYEEGEVLFTGADISLSNLERETVSFSFSLSPNVTNFKVGQYKGADGDSAISITKEGHEYAWVESKSAVKGSTTKSLVGRPLAAHIEQMYPKADFSLLGI